MKYNYEPEIVAMKCFFPYSNHQLLEDGRHSWDVIAKPMGDKGPKYHLMAVCDHNHPHNNTYGGSVKVYCLNPDLDEISKKINKRLPHVLRDQWGNPYICTGKKENFHSGQKKANDHQLVSTVAHAIGRAIGFTYALQCYMDGVIGDELWQDYY